MKRKLALVLALVGFIALAGQPIGAAAGEYYCPPKANGSAGGGFFVGYAALTMICTGLIMGQTEQRTGAPVTHAQFRDAVVDCLTLRGWHKLVHGS